MSDEIVVTGHPAGPLFFESSLSPSGAYSYYSTTGAGVSSPTAPPAGSILTQDGGNKFWNASARPNSAAEVARFVAAFKELKAAVFKLNDTTSYRWTDASGAVRDMKGADIKMFVANMSWVFVDGNFKDLNGGVGMNQYYSSADPRSQVTIDLANAVAYLDLAGGANYIILHEAFHSSFQGRSVASSYVAYSPAWMAREQMANDYAKAIGNASGLNIYSGRFDLATNPGYSH